MSQVAARQAADQPAVREEEISVARVLALVSDVPHRADHLIPASSPHPSPVFLSAWRAEQSITIGALAAALDARASRETGGVDPAVAGGLLLGSAGHVFSPVASVPRAVGRHDSAPLGCI